MTPLGQRLRHLDTLIWRARAYVDTDDQMMSPAYLPADLWKAMAVDVEEAIQEEQCSLSATVATALGKLKDLKKKLKLSITHGG